MQIGIILQPSYYNKFNAHCYYAKLGSSLCTWLLGAASDLQIAIQGAQVFYRMR